MHRDVPGGVVFGNGGLLFAFVVDIVIVVVNFLVFGNVAVEVVGQTVTPACASVILRIGRLELENRIISLMRGGS